MEVGVVVIFVKYSVQISQLIYKNATVHNKCAFSGKQSVYLQGGGEIHVFVIFSLLKMLLNHIKIWKNVTNLKCVLNKLYDNDFFFLIFFNYE